MRRKFNEKMYKYLQKNGAKHTLKEWVNILNKKYNENFTLIDLQRYFWRNNIIYKYECEKKSHGNNNSKLIGTERIKPDGMTQVKISPRKWEYKQRLIYEKYYGVKLTEDDYIIFLDQDRTNFDISNLKRVSKRESSILANQKIFSKNPLVTETGLQVAKLIIKKKEKEKELYGKINKASKIHKRRNTKN